LIIGKILDGFVGVLRTKKRKRAALIKGGHRPKGRKKGGKA